jgi:hypothetical protein
MASEIDRDFLREAVVLLNRMLMEAKVSEQVGSERSTVFCAGHLSER